MTENEDDDEEEDDLVPATPGWECPTVVGQEHAPWGKARM